MRIERELMRGAGPVAVLKLLEPGERYGYELVGILAEVSGGALAMGQSTLYPMLYNLQAKGLVRARWRTTDAGRRRKYYRLTDRGRRRLATDSAQWRALTEAMTALQIVATPPAPSWARSARSRSPWASVPARGDASGGPAAGAPA